MMRHLWVGVLLFGLYTAPVAGQAEDATANSAEPTASDARVRAAVAAYARGELAEARRLFEEEHARAPTARTLRGLGIVASREARYVDAVRLLRAALASEVKPLTPELRQGTETMLADARARVAVLTLVSAQPETTCDEADVLLAREPDGTYLLAPGAHRLSCAAEGYAPAQLLVLLEPGSAQRFDVSLEPSPAGAPEGPGAPELFAAPPAALEPAPVQAALPARRRRLRRALTGLGTVTGLFLVAAGISGGIGLRRARAIARHCRDNPDGLCSADELDSRIAARNIEALGRLTASSFALAGAGALATIGVLPFYYGGSAGAEHSAGLRFTHFF